MLELIKDYLSPKEYAALQTLRTDARKLKTFLATYKSPMLRLAAYTLTADQGGLVEVEKIIRNKTPAGVFVAVAFLDSYTRSDNNYAQFFDKFYGYLNKKWQESPANCLSYIRILPCKILSTPQGEFSMTLLEQFFRAIDHAIALEFYEAICPHLVLLNNEIQAQPDEFAQRLACLLPQLKDPYHLAGAHQCLAYYYSQYQSRPDLSRDHLLEQIKYLEQLASSGDINKTAECCMRYLECGQYYIIEKNWSELNIIKDKISDLWPIIASYLQQHAKYAFKLAQSYLNLAKHCHTSESLAYACGYFAGAVRCFDLHADIIAEPGLLEMYADAKFQYAMLTEGKSVLFHQAIEVNIKWLAVLYTLPKTDYLRAKAVLQSMVALDALAELVPEHASSHIEAMFKMGLALLNKHNLDAVHQKAITQMLIRHALFLPNVLLNIQAADQRGAHIFALKAYIAEYKILSHLPFIRRNIAIANMEMGRCYKAMGQAQLAGIRFAVAQRQLEQLLAEPELTLTNRQYCLSYFYYTLEELAQDKTAEQFAIVRALLTSLSEPRDYLMILINSVITDWLLKQIYQCVSEDRKAPSAYEQVIALEDNLAGGRAAQSPGCMML